MAPKDLSQTFDLRPSAAGGAEYDLMVHGDIGESFWSDESVSAKRVVGELKALPKNVQTINIRINSFGGAVSDGLAIYNALREHSARKVTIVDGVAISAGSLIAMAGDVIKMPATSLMMIHAPSSAAWGNAKEMRRSADVLDKFSEAMLGAYARKTGKSEDEIRTLLTDGEDHWYTAQEAVDAGFADEILDSDDSLEASYTADSTSQILARAPSAVRGRALAAALAYRTPRKEPVMEDTVPAPAVEQAEPAVEAAPAAETAPAPTAALDADAVVAAAVAAKVAQIEAEAAAKVEAALATARAAEVALAAEVEAKEVRAAVEVARADFSHIPGRPEDLGPALRTVAKAAPDALKVIEAALRGAQGLLAGAPKAVGLEPVGVTGAGAALSPQDQVDKLAKAKVEATPGLTIHQARTQVYVENPELVAALRSEGV